MNDNKSRIIITVMRDDPAADWDWVARYNPGQGAPNLQAEGQSPNRKKAFESAIGEACKFVATTTERGAT